MNDFKYYNLSEFARQCGVTVQVALKWEIDGRIIVERPANGVVLVPKSQKKPDKRRSWHIRREERILLKDVSENKK